MTRPRAIVRSYDRDGEASLTEHPSARQAQDWARRELRRRGSSVASVQIWAVRSGRSPELRAVWLRGASDAADRAAWHRALDAGVSLYEPAPPPPPPPPPPPAPGPRRRRPVRRERRPSGPCGPESVPLYVQGTLAPVEGVPARYCAVELASLKASHRVPGFGPSEGYPAGAQERDYRLPAEQAKVLSAARSWLPGLVLSPSPSALDGPPVVAPSGVVLGGNGRTLALGLLYAGLGGVPAATLRAQVIRAARSFGLRGAEVRRLGQPVIVRRLEGLPADAPAAELARWSRRLNSPLGAALDPTRLAVSLARYVPLEALDALRALDPEESLGDYLGSARSRPLVAALGRAGALPAQDAPRYIRADGLLSEDGRRLLSDLLTAILLPDAELLQALGPQLVGTLARAAPYLVQAEGLPGYQLAAPLRAAARDLVSARAAQLSPAEYLRQGSLVPGLGPESTTPEARLLLAALSAWGASPARLLRAVRRYVSAAAAPASGQAALFEDAPPSAAELLRAALAAEGLALPPHTRG